MKKQIIGFLNAITRRNVSSVVSNPIPTTSGITLIKLERTRRRTFYDSKWALDIKTPTGLVSTSLTRWDDQCHLALTEDIEKCSSLEDVQKLDLRERIYYD
ncbi:hypothetical protein AWH56_008950 [Anaerobacillus isosaccharinicus]|uniref:Uncharacterized protein n=1 Tax=Anaerobacillus isosaccharinicus TaxID=1532552 RepID=A0A1S2KY35_9BACI|nr:hypothetical protein [Anaerobacillus isosaccharinicus]QOY37689.1 hypothetical protein AWH56_008950 [Anaerobacillus isosaccharinicus]